MALWKERERVSIRGGRNIGGNGTKTRNSNLSKNGCKVKEATHGWDESAKKKIIGAATRNIGAQVEDKSM